MKSQIDTFTSFGVTTNSIKLHDKRERNNPSRTTFTQVMPSELGDHFTRRKKSSSQDTNYLLELDVTKPRALPYMKINTMTRRKESGVAPPHSHRLDPQQILQHHQRYQSSGYQSQQQSSCFVSRSTWQDIQSALPISQAKEMAQNVQQDSVQSSKINETFQAQFKKIKIEQQRNKEMITRTLQRKMLLQRHPHISQQDYEQEQNEEIIEQVKQVKELILSNFSRSFDKSLTSFPVSPKQQATTSQQKSSQMYQTFRNNMKKEIELKSLLDKNLQKNVDQNTILKKNLDEQDHLERIKFQRLQKANPEYMKEIVKRKFNEMTEEEQFYFRMYLQIKIPFFEQYDRLTMTNICKNLKQKVYDRGEVIVYKGEKSDCMLVILFGQANVYEDDGENCINVISENMSIGERALRVDENSKYTVVAQKVTVCICLQRFDFQKQVFHLEHELRTDRLNYLGTLPITQNWELDMKANLNSYFILNHYGPTEVVYDIGQKPDMIYILRRGILAVNCQVEIETENKFPTGQNSWQIVKKQQKINYELRRIEPNEVFGHQELIENILKKDQQSQDIASLMKPDQTRQTRIVCLTACEILTLDAEHFTKLFSIFQMKNIMETYFKYDYNQSKAKVISVLNEQKFRNKTILSAAANNILSTDGDARYDVSQFSRKRKELKQRSWLAKVNEQRYDDELPRVNGIDRIQVYETTVQKQELVRQSDGSLLAGNFDRKVFSSLPQIQQKSQETQNEITLSQGMLQKIQPLSQIYSDEIFDQTFK